MYRGASVAATTDTGFGLPPYDDVQKTATTALIDTYNYYRNAVKVATVVVTYSDSAHADFLRAQRTF